MRKNDDKMQRQEDKLSDAMKIFEALSSVDEELLERSGRRRRAIPAGIYNKVIAACLCLALAGGGLLAGRYLLTPKGDSAMGDASAQEAKSEAESGVVGTTTKADSSAQPVKSEAESAAVEDFQETGNSQRSSDSGRGGNVQDVNAEQKQQGNAVREDALTDGAQEEKTMLTEDCDIKRMPSLEITEEEARETEETGAYVPSELPPGYRLEEAYRGTETGTEHDLMLVWSKGMDSIFLTITPCNADQAAALQLTDTSVPELYDVNLYEIPYADTVPQKYRESFNDPVFSEHDFSLEVVKARMKSVPDQGDTSTPRGIFSVLYDSGVMVKFNGDGDAEDIWNMFQSISQ